MVATEQMTWSGTRRTTRPPSPAPRRRLPLGVRRATLVVHIVAAGSWIGIDVLVAVLVTAGWFASDPATRGIAYQALGTFTVWPMLASGLVCLASGLLLGLGTKWGISRYWWVLVKLALTIMLCTLIVFALRPDMGAVVQGGRDIAATGATTTELTALFFPPAVSLSLLSVAVALSVFKPWGRVRRRGRRGIGAP